MPPDPTNVEAKIDYSARHTYVDYSVGAEYERVRFRTILGRYRRRREEKAVREVLSQIPTGVSMLDCPCGTGRWWPILASNAREIIATDISPGMLKHAGERASAMKIPIRVMPGDAEDLPLPDGAVDYAFSFALTKHLPWPVQFRVLKELSRVARVGVISTFGVLGHVSYEIWRRRKLAESYPLILEELTWMASEARLRIDHMIRCTTPVGVEHLVRFSKVVE